MSLRRSSERGRPPAELTRWTRARVLVMGGMLMLALGAVLLRAVSLQVLQRARLTSMAADQSVREMEIPARRGEIYDRRGIALAQSVEVDSLWLDPSMVGDLHRAARDLARALRIDASELEARLTRARRFAWVKRQVTPQEVAAAQRLDVPGLGVAKEPKRFYPQRELGAQVLGVVGTDGHGLEGLELAFEDELSGQGEKLQNTRDARGRNLLLQGTPETAGRQGATVTLTLDRQVQYVAEKALDRAVDESKAIGGMLVVLDPRTGELLAIAQSPRFNPNAPAPGIAAGALRDRPALDTFEPGSTYKAFVAAAALEDHAIRPEDAFDCEGGSWEVGRHVIHDTHPHGMLNVARILAVSSNIGAAKVAQRLGRDGMMRAARRFGFGERPGLALAGEGKGSIPYPKAEVTLATQAFGQGLSATAVQVTAAYGALANHGVLMRPYLVARVTDPDGVVLLENQPTQVRQAVSEKTARLVTQMLEGAVQKDGTAPRAALESYRVAGKTGTAQKPDPVARGYSEKRIASFAGIVPADDPRLVIYVMVDEPKTDVYGGLVAAPAFKEVATAALPYLGVPPSLSVLATSKKVPIQAPMQVKEEPAAAQPVTERLEQGSVSVPNVQGQVGRDAVARLLATSLEPRLRGSGRVMAQSPAPGAHVPRGARVTLELGAAP
ncbi:MAG: penicillin-binding transpeptidase domain-containing protein [Myxococcaceae bacterium]